MADGLSVRVVKPMTVTPDDDAFVKPGRIGTN